MKFKRKTTIMLQNIVLENLSLTTIASAKQKTCFTAEITIEARLRGRWGRVTPLLIRLHGNLSIVRCTFDTLNFVV